MNEANLTPERQNQSSSGSAPSEPTIDYSSWPARSNCEKHLIVYKGTPNLLALVTDPPQIRKQSMIRPLESFCLLSSLHEHTTFPATKDQFLPSDTNRIYSLTHLYLISIPSPITLNSLTSHLSSITTVNHALRAARNNHLNRELLLDIVPITEEDARHSGEEISPIKNSLEESSHILSISKKFHILSISDLGLTQPKVTQIAGLSPPQAHSPWSRLFGLSNNFSSQILATLFHFDPQILNSIPILKPATLPLLSPRDINLTDDYNSPNDNINPNDTNDEQIEELSQHQEIPENLPAQLLTLTSTSPKPSRCLQIVKTKSKEKRMATRRSPRL